MPFNQFCPVNLGNLNEPSEFLSILGDVPASISTAISKAISKAPENRYSSCQEFAQDLGIIFASRPKLNEQRNGTQSDLKVTSIPLSKHSRDRKFAFNVLYLNIIGLGIVLTFDLLIKLNAELAYHKGSFAFKT
jgi:hypothetical protein